MVLKVYIDGASRGNPGPAAAAMCVLNEDGSEVVNKSEFIEKATNNTAEYWGLILALKFIIHHAKQGRSPDYLIHSDSKNLVNQMKGTFKVGEALRAINTIAMEDIKEIKKLSPKTMITFEWIPREQNTYTDKLCNQCLDEALSGKVLQHNDPANPQSLIAMTNDEHRQHHATQPCNLVLDPLEISTLRTLYTAAQDVDNLSLEQVRVIITNGGAVAANILRQVNTN